MLIRWPQVVAMGNALVLPLITSTVMLRSAERRKGVERGERAKFSSVGYSNFQNYSYLIPSSLTAPPTQTSLCPIASVADFSNTEKPPCILATRTIFRRSLVFRFLFFFLSFPFFFRLAIAHSQKFIRLR